MGRWWGRQCMMSIVPPSPCLTGRWALSSPHTGIHARTHSQDARARQHTHTHTRTHARTHAHTHTGVSDEEIWLGQGRAVCATFSSVSVCRFQAAVLCWAGEIGRIRLLVPSALVIDTASRQTTRLFCFVEEGGYGGGGLLEGQIMRGTDC